MKTNQTRIAELLLGSREPEGLPDRQRNELNALLRADEANREFAAKFLLDGESLTERLATEEISEISARKCHSSPTNSLRRRKPTRQVALAAVIVVGLACWLLIHFEHPPVAVIEDSAGAVFTGDTAPEQGRLDRSRYSLDSGMVTISFRNGVTLTIRGPAEFEIIDEFRVKLDRGQARAVAPESGHGFTIETQDADVVDLGTEFGVSVDPATGTSDVQVFDGRVDVKDSARQIALASLELGEAVRIQDGDIEAIELLDSEIFPSPTDLGLARWRAHDRKLRSDPDVLIYYPFRPSEDRVGRLVDESSDRLVIDGKISGARWVTGRWPGKQALLFDQSGDAVELEIPGELTEFTFSAWINIDRFDFALTPIFNSAGWEEGDLHLQLSRSRETVFAAVYPQSFRSGARATVETGRWIHLAAIVDTTRKTAATWIDGQAAVSSEFVDEVFLNPGLCRLGSWKSDKRPPKGRDREFRGRIDEVVIWKRVLSEEEIRDLAAAGSP